MIKLYPGYLIISDSPETLFKASFLSRIIIIDIIHCIVVYVIRSMLFQIQSLKEEQELQSKSTIKEVKNLLEKMPEGILIMPDKQSQDCYMN
jgi:c-di-AMP phosphodiesterase-like protein